MDPNTALANLRAALARYRAHAADDALTGAEVAADDLADAAEALDGWLSGGGFLPVGWGGTPTAASTPLGSPELS